MYLPLSMTHCGIYTVPQGKYVGPLEPLVYTYSVYTYLVYALRDRDPPTHASQPQSGDLT